MNKERIEAFTDAVIAIIVTIMVLELKVPDGYTFAALFEEWPDFVAYAVSFTFILVAWYNHHYMFELTKKVDRKVFWANNIWMFATSLYPVSTAWLGEELNHWQPAMFYLLVFVGWAYAYVYLSKTLVQANAGTKVAQKICEMPILRFLKSWIFFVGAIISGALIYVFPESVFFITLLLLPICMMAVSPDSDKLY